MKFNRIQIWTISLTILAIAIFVFIYFCAINLPRCLDGRSHCDFPNYYFAGMRLWNGQPIYYDIAKDVHKFLGYDISYKVYPADPPFTVFILSVYSFLPYLWAWVINMIVSLALLVWVIGLTCRFCKFTFPIFIIFTSAALVSQPFLYLIMRNHYEVILGLLGLLGWNAFKNGKTWSGGIFWGLAASLKLFPAFLFFALPHYIGWRSFFKSLFFFLIFSLLGILAVGIDNSVDFILQIIPKSKMWYGTAGNYSLISFFYALKAPWVGWCLAVVAFLIGIYSSFYGKSNFTKVWISLVILSLLISPLSWLNYIVLIIPIIIILKASINKYSGNIIWGILTFSLFFAPADIVKTSHPWSTVLLSSIPLFGLISLFIFTFLSPIPLPLKIESNNIGEY
jgi:hypothetical protein